MGNSNAETGGDRDEEMNKDEHRKKEMDDDSMADDEKDMNRDESETEMEK